ncbi:MAG: hypothetical protein ACKOKC_05940 [Chthoniobacterales bacterium]
MVKALVPTPAELVAEIVATVVPAAAGIPEITPLIVSTERPDGRFDAPNDVGELEAVIV